ncbi:Dynamitin-domain-containing protein [Sphaerosporella brunnea]|uniref:Dynamitin-domain-containing protein n=1 Tax=Sphaerosporella brunnea TaxID=1250544 RepID=A0A5J5EIP4_9PEZI|nr:Dynamitin-domain-containing protein [Sphaerosporella brunnea]
MSSKYAALPDLDQSQDIYETPDLVSDVSTVPTSTIPDIDSDDSRSDAIDHTRLRPTDAAARFRNADVDARNVDFSDRISGKRRSYVVGTLQDDWDEEEETVEARLARLTREVEELKAQMADKKGKEEVEADKGIVELAAVLEGLATGAEERLQRKLLQSTGAVGVVTKTLPPQDREDKEDIESGTTAVYKITYAPDHKKTHLLGKVAEFDKRLLAMEQVIGMHASALDNYDLPLPANSILPHLDELSRQMAVLSGSTTSSLDSASRRVKQLAADCEKLAEARKAARLAAIDGESLESDETVAKINALYGVLPTVEGMKPILPGLLERLRSLRAIHQDAARAADSLTVVETRQEEMGVEIKKWEEALEKVEGLMKTTTGTIEQNVVKVENWVKEIEKKVELLK